MHPKQETMYKEKWIITHHLEEGRNKPMDFLEKSQRLLFYIYFLATLDHPNNFYRIKNNIKHRSIFRGVHSLVGERIYVFECLLSIVCSPLVAPSFATTSGSAFPFDTRKKGSVVQGLTPNKTNKLVV